MVEETAKWEQLMKVLYKVSCFFKSQERRCPKECDDLLYELWWAWYYAFPGMEFNKFHGLFCGMRNFVHKFESAGRFSEEACESYMAVMEKLKNMLRGMPQNEKRCQLISARSQGNLKQSTYAPKMKILEKCSGKKRGKYAPRTRKDDNVKVVSSVLEVEVYEGERYVKLTNGTFIPEKWLDVYEWYVGRKAPKEWVERMGRSVPRSELEVARESYSLW